MRSIFHPLAVCLAVVLGLGTGNAAPYGLEGRPAFAAYNAGQLPTQAPVVTGDWSTIEAFPSLSFSNPVGLLPIPGTSKLVVWEREGRVYSFENNVEAVNKTLVLDLHDRCQGWSDQGLLGMAFHPQFATNHYVYIRYSWVPPGTVQGGYNTGIPIDSECHQRLSRFTYDPVSGLLNPASEYILIEERDFHPVHGGGGMFFHPQNGFLYLTDGDDISPWTVQEIDNGFFGCLLRIDVDKRGGTVSRPPTRRAVIEIGPNWPEAYYVPLDNPFADNPNALGEIYALGLRSPHRATVDPPTGRVFIGDVGESAYEEVNTIEPGESGLNFQWNRIEGGGKDLQEPYIGINRRPLLAYSHNEGGAVIGGYVYRGTLFPELVGKYLFGDNVSNTIWYLDESVSPPVKVPLATMPRGAGSGAVTDNTGLSSFGYDSQGELYLCQMSTTDARIYKLSRQGSAVSQMPATLSATGVFSDLARLQPVPGFNGYDVNAPAWSDGAAKRRWFAVPSGQEIGFASTGEWQFPNGTVFVKHFELPVDENDPTAMRRLETRVLVRDARGGVYGGSYRWRPDGQEADLVANGFTEDITIQQADGTTRAQTWSYPSRLDCLRCHTPASGGVLGVSTRQTNRTRLFPETGVEDNQLRAWSHAGFFEMPPAESDIDQLRRLWAIDDPQAGVEARARSYLDANCAGCHRPGGAPAFWDARMETPLAAANIVNGFVGNTLGIEDARVIAAGDPDRSLLLHRLLATDQSQMPPVGRNRVDSAAAAVVQQWIALLTDPGPAGLPDPWQHADIGDGLLPGDATGSGGGTFSVRASGQDISGDTDSFHFVYQDMFGSGEVLARVVLQENTDASAKAGVMIRASLDPGSAQAMTALTPGFGAVFQRRLDPGQETRSTSVPGSQTPTWVSIRRYGDLVVSRISMDGVTWQEIGRETVPMGDIVKVGLACCSRNPALVGTALFDNVTVTPGAPYFFTQQPGSALAIVGGKAVFTAATDGQTPAAYAWLHDGAIVPGADTATLTIDGVKLSDAGSYQLLLDGVSTSETATLSVVDQAPAETAAVLEKPAMMAIPSAGPPVFYQWRKNGEALPGQTSQTLTIPTFTEADAGSYSCVVAGAQGDPVVLGPFALTMLRPPTLANVQPPPAAIRTVYQWAPVPAADPTTTIFATGLPPGLSFDSATGTITGRPQASGTYTVQIEAKNAAGSSGTVALQLEVQSFPTEWAGTYMGVIGADPMVNENLGGRFVCSVTASGQLTGRLILPKEEHAFRGVLQGDGAGAASVHVELPRRGTTPLKFDPIFDGTTSAVAGPVSIGPAGQVSAAGKQVAPTAVTAAFAKTYNIALSTRGGATPEAVMTHPGGFLRSRVARSGTATFVGRLSDGSAVMFGARLCRDLSLPFQHVNAGGRSSVAGEPTFTATATGLPYSAEIAGSLDRHARDFTSLVAAEVVGMLGRDYVAPGRGERLLGAGTASIDFTGGGLDEWIDDGHFTESLQVTAASRVIAPRHAVGPRLTLSITPQTGVYGGAFSLWKGSRSVRAGYRGLFIPGLSSAPGVFWLPGAKPAGPGGVTLHAP